MNGPSAPAKGSTGPVDRQLAAYNAHDLGGFATEYADDVELYEFPDKLLAKGMADFRKRYEVRFAEPNLHATLDQPDGGGRPRDRP